jgi:type I restriction enzyme S subunit
MMKHVLKPDTSISGGQSARLDLKFLSPYPDYKQSNIPWIGRLPSHWDVRRLKYLLRERNSRSTSGKEQLLRVSQYTGVTKRVSAEGLDGPDTRAESLTGYKLVDPNDLVINIMLAWNGSMGVSHYAGITSPAYCVYRFNNGLSPWFFHYLLRSPMFKDRIKAISTGVVESRLRLYSDALFRLESILPPAHEQVAIARFLDHANREVDKAIQAKQRVIGLLNEQKQAIIHQVVSRGLNSKAPLKKSGLSWLGSIPTHWKVLQLRRVVNLVTSGSRSWANHYSDSGFIFLQSGNLGRSMSLNLSKIQYVTPPHGAEGERTRVQRDDVLICITGALTGNVAIVDLELSTWAFVNQHVALVRPKSKLAFPRYLATVLHSEIGRIQFKVREYGGTKQGLGLDDVKSALIPLPPIEEQEEICRAIDSETSSLSRSIQTMQREILLLREYRTRLIVDVVTGKLDVRAAAAQLPEDEGPLDAISTDDGSIEEEASLEEAMDD